ncbi:hypothetical protein INP59_27050 (plasmid) [Rhodococcus pyridinivorans]|uniref:Uncharacterized protein n=1 Tax=Rhodococcus pyridinivorans TaxID=103816 RepID=A0A7M2XXJ8_9NOCA|nr:hypothetical protein INP59_27050 [Rhodococcus pyridinivorans]
MHLWQLDLVGEIFLLIEQDRRRPARSGLVDQPVEPIGDQSVRLPIRG